METHSTLPESLRSTIADLHVHDEEGFIATAEKFRALLEQENNKFNLTRLTSPLEYWIKHVIDSLFILKYFPDIGENSFKMADIGAGAGFPSVILAIACPKLRVSAIDSTGKKTDFIRMAAKELSLGNLEVITARANELSRSGKKNGYFDIITARAVSSSENIFSESWKMLSPAGRIILYKTPRNIEEEMPPLLRISQRHGFTWKTSSPFSLPENMGERIFLSGAR